MAVVLLVGFMCIAHAQTNVPVFKFLHDYRVQNSTPTNFYNAGETVAEFAPTITSDSLFNTKLPHTYGYSLELEHWTATYMGTGLEFGSYNYHEANYGALIDHIAIMQDFRMVPFQGNPLFSRFAVGIKTGAETFFLDGSKDVELGGELYWTFTDNCRLETDIVQHIRTNSNEDGQTARLALQWVF